MILRYIISKLGLHYLSTPFLIFYGILKYIISLAIDMIYVILFAGMKSILTEFTFMDKGKIANNYINAIWTTWVVSIGKTRKGVSCHPLY